MHDFSLGGPVDVGRYDGPLLNGKPIHSGNCEDGVYGCRMCNAAVRRMSDEDRRKVYPNDPMSFCDWCNADVPHHELSGVRPIDEGGRILYEVCGDCKKKYNDNLEREIQREEYE